MTAERRADDRDLCAGCGGKKFGHFTRRSRVGNADDDSGTHEPPVLRHRIMLNPDKEMEGTSADEVVKQIVDKVEVPR